MDRSSEERSRFEDNARRARVTLELWAMKEAGHQPTTAEIFAIVDREVLGARAKLSASTAVAALEDRQEAAPPKGTMSYLEINVREVLDERDDLRQRVKELEWKLDNPGVPSEATPSKENARPAGKCGKCDKATFWHGDTWYHEYGEDVMKCGMVEPQTAPAPEVQGTLNWKGLAIGQWFFMDSPECECRYSVQERTGGGCSIVCSTPYVHEGAANDMKEIARLHNQSPPHNENPALPVGTPQKETPPLQCTWVDRMDFTGGIQCTFQRGHKGPHSFEKSAPVPEGVQGKEPQTPDTSPILTGEDATRFLEAMRLGERTSPARLEYLKQCARESIAAEKEGVSPDEQRAYKSGEAAGRRSVITEMKERVYTSILSGQLLRSQILAWCIELQEKKP